MELIDYVVIALNLVVLVLLTVQDIKYRQVNIVVIAVYGLLVTGVSFLGNSDVISVLLGILPGIILIALSFITDGKIGIGDGILVLALGLSMGLRLVFGMLLVALFFSAITGIILMVMKKANRKTALPFVPFLFSGYVVCEIINLTII